MQSTRNSVSKSNRVHLVADNPQPGIHLIGLAPLAEMKPDEYKSNCVNVVFYRFKKQVFLDHQVIEGPHAGTVLPQWINNVGDRINPRSAFAKQCAAALGRELSVNDDLEPVAVFKGKSFRVWVGWRMSMKPRGGRFDDKLALYRRAGSVEGSHHHRTGGVMRWAQAVLCHGCVMLVKCLVIK